MQLFSGLKKLREHEKGHLPFLRTLSDFDIVIEIGYQEELGQPIGLKQLYLLNICSRATVRRRLSWLVEHGVIHRRPHAKDRRAFILVISQPTLRSLGRFSAAVYSVAGAHFS